MVIVFGIALCGYAIVGVSRYGFYISGRGDPGQMEGGLAVFFLLIGILAIAYGSFGLIMNNRE